MREYKIILDGEKCREKLFAGINKVADIVKVTLGSPSKNVMIEYKGKSLPTNDGSYIARTIILKDESENMGAQALIDVGNKTNDMVGDGTTTSMVLARAIIKKAKEEIGEENALMKNSVNVFEIKNRINQSCQRVVEELKKMAMTIKEKEAKADLVKVATVAVEDEKIGQTIGEMMAKLGPNGFASVEDGFKYETEFDVVEGAKFPAKYSAPYMVTNPERFEAVIENPYILLTNQEINDGTDLLREVGKDWVLNDLIKLGRGRQLVIMAPKFGEPVLRSFYQILKQTGFFVLAVKIPALTDDEKEDIAIYTGANFFNHLKGMKVGEAKMEKIGDKIEGDLGEAEKIIVNRDEMAILGAPHGKKIIQERIKELTQQIEAEEMPQFKNRLKQRISSLSGAIGIIRVGAKTDAEKNYLKRKIEDAVYSCRAAWEEGIVPGGGLALKRIAEKLSKDDILKDVLIAPYEQMQENAGGKLDIDEKKVVDAVKVVKIALENACSMAGVFVMTEALVVEPKSGLEQEFKNLILGTDELEKEKI